MRRAAKVDSNHSLIVEALRRHGCSVSSLAAIGDGVPDLLVGYLQQTHLVEVKDGEKAPSRRRLTEDQREWWARWRGSPPVVVESVEDAVNLVTQWRVRAS